MCNHCSFSKYVAHLAYGAAGGRVFSILRFAALFHRRRRELKFDLLFRLLLLRIRVLTAHKIVDLASDRDGHVLLVQLRALVPLELVVFALALDVVDACQRLGLWG